MIKLPFEPIYSEAGNDIYRVQQFRMDYYSPF